MPVADGEDVRVEDDVLRREADFFGQQLDRPARQMRDLVVDRRRPGPASSNAITTTAAP